VPAEVRRALEPGSEFFEVIVVSQAKGSSMKSANSLRWRGIGIALSAAIILTACGGGGDGGAPVPPPIGGGTPTPTPSPTPEPTPTPTASPAPTPTPTPTASPVPTPTPAAFDPAAAAALDAAIPGVTPNADEPTIAMDAQGNATVVWIQTDGTRKNVFARRFNATTQTFEDQKLIGRNGGGDVQRVSLKVNGNGDAVAIWTQSDGNATPEEIDVVAAVYTGGTWGPAERVADQSALGGVAKSASNAKAAFGPDGMIVAVWRTVFEDNTSTGGDADELQSSTYDPVAKAWGQVLTIERDSNSNLIDSHVVVLPNKDALVVYIDGSENAAEDTSFRIRRKAANSTDWLPGNVDPNGGATQFLPGDPGTNNSDMRLATNEAGQVQIVWKHRFDVTGGREAILTAFLPADSKIWSAPIVADITAGDSQSTDGKLGKSSDSPSIVMDKNGKSTITWQQNDLNPNTGGIRSLYAIQFDIAQKKFDSATPYLVDDSANNLLNNPSALSVNAAGNVFALWEQISVVGGGGVPQRVSVYASQFDAAAKTWSKPGLVEADDSVNTEGDLGIAIAPNNTAIAVWQQNNRVMFNRSK
jgi:hypothetical protein